MTWGGSLRLERAAALLVPFMLAAMVWVDWLVVMDCFEGEVGCVSRFDDDDDATVEFNRMMDVVKGVW